MPAFQIGNKIIEITEIGKEIFIYLKKLSEEHLIKSNFISKEINKVVITVPAYFDEAAKYITKLSAQLAGFEVIRLINEPTAAAISFGINEHKPGNYLIYDLGGGTFDVSIIKMNNAIFKVLGVAGNNNRGGDDFDFELANYLSKKYQQKISLFLAKKIKEEVCKNGFFSQKITIEDADETTLLEINLAEFNGLIAEKINQTVEITQNLLQETQINPQQINLVLLIGGSSRIPLIKQELAKILEVLPSF